MERRHIGHAHQVGLPKHLMNLVRLCYRTTHLMFLHNLHNVVHVPEVCMGLSERIHGCFHGSNCDHKRDKLFTHHVKIEFLAFPIVFLYRYCEPMLERVSYKFRDWLGL